MKKITTLLITSALLLSVTGCSAISAVRLDKIDGNKAVVATTAVTTTAPETTAVEETVTTTASTTTSKPVETTANKSDEQKPTKEEINALIEKASENNKDVTKPAETTKPAVTTTVDNSIWDEPPTTTTNKKYTLDDIDEAAVVVDGNIYSINRICGLKSDVETDIEICAVDVYDEHNPYDVVYNYGTDYNAFVKACDWSLVFDADYYIMQFPMLAAQYHNDKALLLEHFQTVGIHEGRQGSEKFNVMAYKTNCDSEISKAFGDNYEGYYFYYMLNYNTEKSVKTTGNYKNQYKQIMTACQAAELEGVNNYRAEVGAKAYPFNSELAALAAYRGYINAHDGYRSHDWFVDKRNFDFLWSIVERNNGNNLSENTWYMNGVNVITGRITYDRYRESEPHYKAMISTKYDRFGSSNIYFSKKDHFATQFQMFLDL